MVKKLKPFLNIGPGEFIKEELEYRNWNQQDLAQILDLSERTISKLINSQQSISIEIAKLLSKTFGQSPQYWLNLDNNYRLGLQENPEKEEKVRTKATIYQYMPVRELCKKNWMQTKCTRYPDLLEAVKEYWKISELDFSFIEKELLPNFRRSQAFSQFNQYYALTWFRMAQRCTKLYEVEKFDRNRLKALAENLSYFTTEEDGISQFLNHLNEVGVKFFVLSHLQKTYVDGAAFFDNQSPVIVYTQRYNRIDNFWFTVAHELSHVLLHLKTARNRKHIFIDNLDYPDDREETEANTAAETWLKTNKILAYFEKYKHYVSQKRVLEFAGEISLHPAIIIGVLQHHGMLDRRYLNDLKLPASDFIPRKYYSEEFLEEL